jgi:hypothetical protein
MLGPIRQLIHNKFGANSILLAIKTEVLANPRWCCSGMFSSSNMMFLHFKSQKSYFFTQQNQLVVAVLYRELIFFSYFAENADFCLG